jgi:hypothetical protein
MSKVSIAGDVNGTGVFTIASPNSNVNRTITLPDEAGTILTTAGVPFSALPAGSVLQVIQGTTTVRTSVTGLTFTATTLTATITPKKASSKILVFGQGMAVASQSTAQPIITLYRGGLNIIGSPVALDYGFGNMYTASGGYIEGMLPFSVLDVPSTSSSTTYTLYLRNNGVGTASFGSVDRLSVITLMEIAA